MVSKKDFRFLLLASYAAFGVYFCMYAFRKPFTVATFEGQSFWGIDFKIILIIAQVVGYMASKFMGIKFVAELKPNQRFYYLMGMIIAAELALVLFGLLPPPYSLIALFLNGLFLGMIWGIVFSYLEGRRFTEILGVVLCSSFIVSSGAVKSAGLIVMNEMGVSEVWMPAVTGAFFLLPFLSFALLLNRIPPPSAEDLVMRSERVPMNKQSRRKVFLDLAFPLAILVVFYIFLTALRDFRDNFSREIWDALGYAGNTSVYTLAEIPVALLVLVSIGLFALIKDNSRALRYYHYLFVFGALYIGVSSFLFQQNSIGPAFWMINTGLGLYLCYVPFNCIFFDRLIATFRIKGNSGFLIYIADSFGYLGSMAVLLYKNFGQSQLSWLQFLINGTYAVAVIGSISAIISLRYFIKKHKNEVLEPKQISLIDL